MATTTRCRICGGTVREFLDFGRQPLADSFVGEAGFADEFFYRLAVGLCGDCTMVQLMEEVPHERMFHRAYPYQSSGSTVMQAHFEKTAHRFLENDLKGGDPLIIELGSNDGAMLESIARAGVRHVGVEPCGDVAELAAAKGITVVNEFFSEQTADRLLDEHGTADVIFSANTFSHISYIDSIFRGIDLLLAPSGIFVFEDPYLADIVELTSFDQIYDEHFYFFSVRSVQAMAARFGFELVDVERLPVHGGELRYTVVRAGARRPSAAVAEALAEERTRGIALPETLERFADNVRRVRGDLMALLRGLREQGKSIAGYGATAKSSTVMNYCGITSELIGRVYDNTPAKQGWLTPGSHIPVLSPAAFAEAYPDYAVLFAWNHADEIMAKERGFREAGGKWIFYVPDVHVV